MTGSLMILYLLIILIALIIILATMNGNKKHKQDARKRSLDQILGINRLSLAAILIIVLIAVILLGVYYIRLSHS